MDPAVDEQDEVRGAPASGERPARDRQGGRALAGGQVLTSPSLNYRQLNLRQFIDAIGKLLARSTEEEPDGWLVVDLWEATAMDKQPTKEDLDRLPTTRPIIVFSLDGHIAVVNSRALAIADIDASTSDPPGGKIKRGRGNEPTGILLDNAIGLVTDRIPAATTEQNARTLAAGLAEMAKQGITSFLEVSAEEKEIAALALLSDQGRLTARPSVALYGDSELARDPGELLAHVEQMRTTYSRPDVTIGTVKLFFDGVIEHPTQTAALLRPYRVKRAPRATPSGCRARARARRTSRSRSRTLRSRRSTPPGGRSTCTQSAIARCAQRSMPSSTPAPRTG